MKEYLVKIKHIVPIYLLVACSTVILLLAVRWGLSISTGIIDIREDNWEFIMPMVLSFIVVIVWIRPKLRILKPHKNGQSYSDFFIVVSWLSIMAASLVAQQFLSTSTGKLLRLDSINQIADHEPVRYYHVENFSVLSEYPKTYLTSYTTGKYSSTLNHDLYVAVPIIAFTNNITNDTTLIDFNQVPLYWYGIRYTYSIRDRATYKEKEKARQVFNDDCDASYRNHVFNDHEYFERLPKSKRRSNYINAIQQDLYGVPDDSIVVLEPRYEPFEERNGNKFFWIFGSLGIGLIVMVSILSIPDLDKREFIRQKAGIKPEKDNVVEALKYLVPAKEHWGTSVILDINLVVFIIMFLNDVDLLSPTTGDLVKWGGNISSLTPTQPWRLLTNIFVHGGVMHLTLNIAGLVIGSYFAERIYGRWHYLILYLLSGISGSLLSLWWHEHVNVVSVGASGAIFGLFGAILALLATNAFPKTSKKSIFIFIALYAIVSLIVGLMGGVDNAAHIGGLTGGAIVGYVLYRLKRQESGS